MSAQVTVTGGESDAAASLQNIALVTAAAVKHSSVARAIAKPAMVIQFVRRDRAYASSPDSAYIRSLRGSCAGRRCFIIGNGPSLTTTDLDKLVEEDTFAANGIVNVFKQTSWRPKYYLAVDREYIAHEAHTMPELPVGHVFVNLTPFSKELAGSPKVTLLNKRPAFFSLRKYTLDNIAFSEDPSKFVAEGYSVTYTALQMALYMGYSDIYLVGMDHTYTRVADRKGSVSQVDGVTDHCYVDVRGTHVNPQYREGVEFAYLIARIAAEQRGVRILNATRGGALEVFERADLDKVLERLE